MTQAVRRPNPIEAAQDYQLSQEQFHKIATIAEANFGLSLQPTKKPLVLSRLSKRLRALGMPGFDPYLELFDQIGDANPEMEHLLTSLTTNVTHFFRERHHFELLKQTILPPMMQHAQAGGRVRLWSAGCSSGQEAYSIAMTILEAYPDVASWDVKILATDLDPLVIDRAKAGTYAKEDVAERDQPLFNRYFVPAGSSDLSAGKTLRNLISFGRINLISDWPIRGPFDAIFCRNVAIYFEKETQERLWKRFSDLMCSGAYLLIGHSERIANPDHYGLAVAGVTSYRRL